MTAESRRIQNPDTSLQQLAAKLQPEDLYDAARMTFLELILSGVTCVGEFHELEQTGGAPGDLNQTSHEILRAAKDTGIRIALLRAAHSRQQKPDTTSARAPAPSAQDATQFARNMDALRAFVAREYPGDETWLGVGIASVLPEELGHMREVAAYAHAQRMRLHVPLSATSAEHTACIEQMNRTPLQLLSAAGLVDKRFTAIHAAHLDAADAEILGSARAIVCHCPPAHAELRSSAPPLARLLAAGGSFALGTDSSMRTNPLEEARQLRMLTNSGSAEGCLDAIALLRALTSAGARSLGAPTGALEVGRPADFFTVNLRDPSMAGADADSLLEHVVFAAERRAIREVWIGGQRRIAGGRHPYQGAIVGRFCELQDRLRGAPPG